MKTVQVFYTPMAKHAREKSNFRSENAYDGHLDYSKVQDETVQRPHKRVEESASIRFNMAG